MPNHPSRVPLSARPELEAFQTSEGENQGRDDYYDTKRVYELLQKQSELKHMMTDYVNEHHTETFDMSEV